MVIIQDIKNIREFLIKKICSQRTVIAFIGSPLRNDDRVALLIYNDLIVRLKNNLMNIWFIECEYGLENCIHEIVRKNPETLIIVDAILSQELKPGEIVLASWDHVRDKIGLATTHNIPIYITLSLLSSQVVINEIYLLGIRIKDIGIGMSISDEVDSGREKLADLLLEVIKFCSNRGKH
ncbi:MAG: hydrogenase maturation protease [Staphylothermus sp.]|nr:hydrogenase maturation protease [Staphylothermus sp.]